MKRALIVGTGTMAGVAAVLALNPSGGVAVAGSPVVKPAPATGSSSTSTSTSTGTSGSSPTSGSSAASKTAAGSSVDVGYGIVQVQVTVTGGRIVDISALSLPQNDGHSARISQQAFPMLVSQALAAQSSQIAGVSGASYTSYGFAESLKAALVSAGHAA
jgi:uncharacterized protein with FMN-binding domain